MAGGDAEMLGRALDEFDPDRPSPARIYDYWLGGRHNFAADRAVAEEAVAFWPELPTVMRINRAFLQRAVRYLISVGIRQFLDLGSGIPTRGNVHEIAQQGNTGAKVVYVDLDPVAVSYSRAMLASNHSAIMVQADLREPAALLECDQVRAMLELDKPVAVMMIALLHFILDDDQAAEIVASYRDALVPGSYLAMSHACSDGCEEQATKLEQLYEKAQMPFALRSHTRAARLFEGFELVDPGVVSTPLWRPDDDEATDFLPFPAVSGVGYLAPQS